MQRGGSLCPFLFSWSDVEVAALLSAGPPGLRGEAKAGRFEEAFTIIRRLLAGERVDYDGRYYRVEGAELHPRARRPGGPPLMIGSMGNEIRRGRAMCPAKRLRERRLIEGEHHA